MTAIMLHGKRKNGNLDSSIRGPRPFGTVTMAFLGVLCWCAGVISAQSQSQSQSHTEIIHPKMNAKPVLDDDVDGTTIKPFRSRRRLEEEGALPPDLTARMAVFAGICHPNESFHFPLSGESGEGMAVVMMMMDDDTDNGNTAPLLLDIEIVSDHDHDNDVDTPFLEVDHLFVHENPLALGMEFNNDHDPPSWGTSFTYGNIGGSSGGSAKASFHCPSQQSVNVFVLLRDDSNVVLEATVSHSNNHKQHPHAEKEMRVEIVTQADLAQPMVGQVLGETDNGNGRSLQFDLDGTATEGVPVTFEAFKNCTAIAVRSSSSEQHPVLLHVSVRDHDNDGRISVVHRTFVTRTRHGHDLPPTKIQEPLTLEPIQVDDHGDFVVTFNHLDTLLKNKASADKVHIQARIGVSLSDSNMVVPVIDMSAILPTNGPSLMVHSAWVKLTLERQAKVVAAALPEIIISVNATSFEIVVLEVELSDPDTGYVLAHQTDLASPGFATTARSLDDYVYGSGTRRHLLHDNQQQHRIMTHMERALSMLETPLSEHERSINLEMLEGRPPADIIEAHNRNRRELQGSHKGRKMLVHGYCATKSPFPTNHFTNAIVFRDPAGYPSKPNWSHDEFARKLNQFAKRNKLDGCSCIAHSQGGAACLHLQANYFSCLDNTRKGGNALIQSVGTPYQGTTLASEAAILGSIFGIGCGENYDLSYKGSAAWLKTIPRRARKKVHYYTTSFAGLSFGNNCNALTDLMLDDPDDGVTEKWSGQLVGGRNKGHTYGQCHTRLMKDDAQCTDRSRNRKMNKRAAR
jgi:hypothetical protein